ncbi:MAG: DUF499 domain-containing protein [Anaerolineae bacterium]|nr:DUF499 domain-containing protein [Anaerolineae bacterium]
MNLDPWYKVVVPRKEVREGRSFNPDEFAIALEQVVAGIAPEDYCQPGKFFARTYFTRALNEHMGMVLRRLAGETANTAPVLSLITQFGGGKTHTLTALYHLANNGPVTASYPGIADFLLEAKLEAVPKAKVAVFVGNAWDPQPGRETPWLDVARQLAGDEGAALLGLTAQSSAPGTEALGRLFTAAGGPVLILFDEVLNFVNRHRSQADQFYAFIHNLTVAMTGAARSAAVISLPRSKLEMTSYDLEWQDKLTKVVRRVAKDLIALDEAEIAEVVRRRLFENIGPDRVRRQIAKAFADWCFERRAQLPPEWTAVDTATTEARSREFLQGRFEACYPFHPATLSVFQRKWQALPQYQQTRGTLAMLAQWISLAYRDAFLSARREPLITLGSAPLDGREFRSIVLGQLGEPRLEAAIESDISGQFAHARALDADAKDALRDIHRRVGAAILFESSGGQIDKVAHLPELRFALGEPEVDTTSVDNAALSLETRAYFIRRVGSDGFKVYHTPTLRKVMNDRRASLDEKNEIQPALRELIRTEFDRGRTIPLLSFPTGGDEVSDSPKLTLVLIASEMEWSGNGGLRAQMAEWTKRRGGSARLYPGALVWCFKKPGRELRDKVETWLAWQRVKREIDAGTLGDTFDRAELADIKTRVKDAEDEARDEIWASYRFIVLADNQEPDGLKVIDLGAGHSSGGNETLCGRIIAALKSQALLNESVGAGYLERNWPPALKDTGAWPLASLRQSFLNGALTRLLDPDTVLRGKIVDFVVKGDFGLASGQHPDGTYDRVWYDEPVAVEEVAFEAGVFLLTKARAVELKRQPTQPPVTPPKPPLEPPLPPIEPPPGGETPPVSPEPQPGVQTKTLRLVGPVPPELWNRLGTKLVPKLRSGIDLVVTVEFTVAVNANLVPSLVTELNQILAELGLGGSVRVEVR